MKFPRPFLTIACVLALGAAAAWANSVSTPNIPVVGPVLNGDLLLGTRSGVTYNMSWPPASALTVSTFLGSTTTSNPSLSNDLTTGLYTSAPGQVGVVITTTPKASWTASRTYDYNPVTINLNTGALASTLTGSVLQLGNANATPTRIESDVYGSSSYLSSVRLDGTTTSPTAILSGDEIGGVNAWGYNGAAVAGPQASVREYAAANWTTTGTGTYVDIATTPTTGTTMAEVARFNADGGLTLPSTVTGGDEGAGTINAAGLYVNGVPVSSGSISGLNAATTAHSFDNLNYPQTWTWNTLTSNNALTISTTDATTGNLLTLLETSTGASGGSAISATMTGSTNTGYAGYFANTSTAGYALYSNGVFGVANALKVSTTTGTPVNYLSVIGSATGAAPIVTVAGTDTFGAGLGMAFTALNATATGAGGSLILNAGQAFGLANGGDVDITAGGSSSTTNSSLAGNVNIVGGVCQNTGAGNCNGNVNLTGGTATAGTGGNVNITSGAGSSGKASGSVNINGANGGASAGGTVTIAAGGSTGTQTGVDTSITGGAGGTTGAQAGGRILITGGTGNSSAAGGVARLLGGTAGATGTGGQALVQGGTAIAGGGGAATVVGGAGVGSSNTGGAAQVTGGAGAATGAGGSVVLTSGAGGSTSGVAGNVVLALGVTTSSAGGTLPSIQSGGFLQFTTTQAAIAAETGIHMVTANALALSTSGVDRITVSNAGLVTMSSGLNVTSTIQQGIELSCSTGLTTDGSGNINGCVASDASLKTNIQPLVYDATLIDRLQPVSYDWREPARYDDKKHGGFIAQQVQIVDPLAVKSAGKDLLGLDNSALAADIVLDLQSVHRQLAADHGAFPFHKCFFGLLVCAD